MWKINSILQIYIGKIDFVSFVIKSGRKLTIGVTFECQGMTQRKLFLLFPLFKFFMVYCRLPDNWRTKDYKRTQHKHTTQTIGAFIAWISTEYSYISLLSRLLREYPLNTVIVCKFPFFFGTLSCLNSIDIYNDQFKYKCMLFFSGLEQKINTLCKRIKINEIQHI